MNKAKNKYLDKYFMTNEGYKIKVVEYIDSRNIKIQFECGTTLKVLSTNLSQGTIKNPMHKSVYGVGYLGIGKYKTKVNGKLVKVYQIWANMLQRCYDDKMYKKHPTYIDCSVAEDWHNYQNFCTWFYDNYKEGCDLDKDILVKGNKVYSSSTCSFVPTEINNLLILRGNDRGGYLIGVHKRGNKFISQLSVKGKKLHLGVFGTELEAFQSYKITKENYIKDLADKWRDELNPIIYNSLINYQVEITD